jgi:hypothetical protein
VLQQPSGAPVGAGACRLRSRVIEPAVRDDLGEKPPSLLLGSLGKEPVRPFCP